MAKGNNNIRNKKPHSSKPYDVSNSFVKKVTSGVSSLLPQGSWLTRWFASGSTAGEERQSTTNDGDNDDEQHLSHSPPTKRARIPLNRPFPANSFRVSSPIDRGETHPWPSESVASPIPNVFSDSAVPGPSGLSRTPIVSGPFQSPSTNLEGLEGKINGDGGSDSSESTSGCSSLAPQRATSSGTTGAHRASAESKITNHMSSYSLFPSATHKFSPSVNITLSRRRPSFNVSSFGSPNLDSSKLSRESSLNSPFYIGRTIFGGASAYRRPREGASSEQSFLSSTRRGGVTVRPANEKSQASASAETSMSLTARRILEALEQFSSPVSEARRMPLPPQPALSAKRKRPLESMSNSPAKSTAPAAITNPLTIPMPPERLRLHRLQDVTEAARRIASSVSNTSNKYTLRSNDGFSHAGTGKVTKSKPLDEDDLPLPVNLPHVSLPITTLPSFDLFTPQVQSSSDNSRTNTSKIVSKATIASGEDCDQVEGDKNKTTSAISTFTVVNTSSNVNLSAATSSGMKFINFMHVKSSTGVPKSKIGVADASYTECSRKREISSESANVFTNPSKSNPKSVSFSGTVSYHVNNPVNPKDKVEKPNNSLSSDMSNANEISTFVVKGAPFSNAHADSDYRSTTNDFAFSTPTVISTVRVKETHETKSNNFDFCNPEMLDCSKYGSKLKRNEPNGFHKLHSSSKVEHGHDSPVVLNAGYKDGSGKMNVNKDTEINVESTVADKTVASREKENNGWGSKFRVPDSWECPSCMVRNKNDVKICVCCGSKLPSISSSISTDIENKPSAMPSTVASVSSSPGWGNKFTLQPGMWECSACFVRNKTSDVNCVSCCTPKNGSNKSTVPVSTPQTNWGSQFRLNAGMWECSACLVRNKEQDIKCVSCTTPRSSNATSKEEAKTSNDWEQKFKKPSGSWECPVCMIPNKDSLLKCAACQEPKPGMDKNRSSTGGSIKFNFEMPSSSSSFKFGIDKAELKQPEISNAMFSFGGSRKNDVSVAPAQTGFVFGANTTESKIPVGIKFGISSPESSSIITNEKPGANTGESKVSSTNSPNVPASGTCTPASPVQTDTTKVSGITFGVPVSTSIKPCSESIGEAKKLGSTSGSNDSSKKDFKFSVPQASPIMSSATDAEKKSGTFTVSPSKSEQKSAAEGKASYNFSTSTTGTAATTTLNVSSTTMTTANTGSKPGTFSFTSNLTTSASTAAGTATITTTAAAVATPISSLSAPIFSFGSNSASLKPVVTSTPTFSFGGAGVQTTSSGIFGATPSSQFKSSGDGLFSNKLTASPTIPVFGGSSVTSPKMSALPSFGSSAGASTTTTNTTTATTTTTTTTATTAVAAAVTAATSSVTPTTSATTNISTFGTPAAPSLNMTTAGGFGSGIMKPTFSNVASNFGSVTSAPVISTTVSTSTAVSTLAPGFGLQSTTASTTPSFGAPSTTSSFSSSVPSFGSTTTPSFGMPTTTASVANPTSTPAPSFGTASGVPFGGASASGNNFGASSATPNFSTTASSVFGTNNTPSFGSASTTPAFGSASAASNFGSSFGSANTTAPTFGTSTQAVTTASSSSLPVFGAFSNSAKPAQGIFMFGSNPTTTTLTSNFSFNVATQAGGTQPAPSGTTAFSFGSGAVSSATNVTTSTSTTPTAVAVASAPAPAQGFGGFSFTGSAAPATTPSVPSLFGNASATPVFGAPSVPSSAPSSHSFGTGSSTNTGVFRPPSFNFGSGGSQQPFAFGSGAQSGATQSTGNSGFSFGQGQPGQSQPLQQFNPNARPTFNFTGGETPQFTASSPASTPTPQRRMKKAVRRTLR